MPYAGIYFLHTAAVHQATFDALVAEKAPGLTAMHIIEPDLLEEARRQGGVTPELRLRIDHVMQEAALAGAEVIVCTCSTIARCAEEADRKFGARVIRIDRPMARTAVAQGRKIAVVAALETALHEARSLIAEEAAAARCDVDIIDCYCPNAWPLFEVGELSGYHRSIAKCVAAIGDADVVVLAQASMAGAAHLCDRPVLTSPDLAVDAALASLVPADYGPMRIL